MFRDRNVWSSILNGSRFTYQNYQCDAPWNRKSENEIIRLNDVCTHLRRLHLKRHLISITERAPEFKNLHKSEARNLCARSRAGLSSRSARFALITADVYIEYIHKNREAPEDYKAICTRTARSPLSLSFFIRVFRRSFAVNRRASERTGDSLPLARTGFADLLPLSSRALYSVHHTLSTLRADRPCLYACARERERDVGTGTHHSQRSDSIPRRTGRIFSEAAVTFSTFTKKLG